MMENNIIGKIIGLVFKIFRTSLKQVKNVTKKAASLTKKIGSAVIGDDEVDDHGDKFQIEFELTE